MKKIFVITSVIFLLHIISYNKAFALSRDGQPIIAYYFNYWGAPFGNRLDRGFSGGWKWWSNLDSNGNPVSPDGHGNYPNSNNLDPGRESWRRQILTGDWVTYPLIGPYDSSNPDIVSWQVRNAKNAGIDAFAIMMWDFEFKKNQNQDARTLPGDKEWWTAENVTIPTIQSENFHFIIGDEMVGTTSFNPDCDYNSSPYTCQLAYNPDVYFSVSQMPANIWDTLKSRGLTQKRYADLVLNAYTALSKWKDNPAYLRIDNKPVYFIPLIELYRDNPSLLNTTLRTAEELLGVGAHGIYWFGYDGNITWGDPNNANVWRNIVDGIIDGFGTDKALLIDSNDLSFENISNGIDNNGLDWIAHLSVGYNDTGIRNKCRNPGDPPGCIDDVYNAYRNTRITRHNGDTFTKGIRLKTSTTIKPKMYWLASWNATYLEGYTVEPAITWGDDGTPNPDSSQSNILPWDPYHYLRILARDLTGANFSPAPLPNGNAIDPVMANYLGINSSTVTLCSRCSIINGCQFTQYQSSNSNCSTVDSGVIRTQNCNDCGPISGGDNSMCNSCLPSPTSTPILNSCPFSNNCTFSGICAQNGGTCQSQYTCSQPGIIADCCCLLPTTTPIPPSPTPIPPTLTPIPTSTPIPPSPTPTPIPGDITGKDGVPDGKVDIYDYNKLIGDFGKTNSPADINGNGIVDIYDYNTLVGNFGKPR